MRRTAALLTPILIGSAALLAGESPSGDRSQEELRHELDAARRDLEEAVARIVEIQRRLADERLQRDLERRIRFVTGRAGLGVVLETGARPAADRIGASIVGITPGSPAEEAGLRPGDIITTYNGAPLVEGAGREGRGRSSPALRIIEWANGLLEGEQVTLEYQREGRTESVTLTARRLGPRRTHLQVAVAPRIRERFEVPVEIEIPEEDFESALQEAHVEGLEVDAWWPDPLIGRLAPLTGGSSWSGRELELVALTPELGEYFGTERGLLVVRAGKGGLLPVRTGDVILKVADREPATPLQAARLLRAAAPGRAVDLLVLRKGARLTLKAEAPLDGSHAHPAPPAPPSPPAPPPPKR